MRNVDRADYLEPVELSSEACIAHLSAIINNPILKVDSDLYKGKIIMDDGTIRFTVREALKSLYQNKCAYCEKYAYTPKIDHHRPKGRVVGMPQNSAGYYWLAYQWDNLLPSCTDCNAIGAKASNFPVVGIRKTIHPTTGNPPAPDSLSYPYSSLYNISENPLLLHPEYSVASDHFAFDKDGNILGLTNQGISTIRTLKLNSEDLVGWRHEIYMLHLNSLLSIVRKYYRHNNPIAESVLEEFIYDWTLELVVNATNGLLEYTFFRKFILKELDQFFITELEIPFRDKVRMKVKEALEIIST